MSSTASELNALGSTTSVDFYKRLIRHDASDAHYVKMARWFTIGWGIVAILLANVGSLFENLIQFVNIVGSLFYGTILGIFLSAFLLPKMHRHAVFLSAILAEGIVLLCYLTTDLGFLWYNVLGCVLVMIPGLLMSMLIRILEKSIKD